MVENMNVIILAADSKAALVGDENSLPRCFLPLNNNLTILERQIRTLKLYGIAEKNMILVVGAQGPWAKSGMLKKAREIHPYIAINRCNADTGTAASLLEGLKMSDGVDDLLVIDADLVFDSKILDLLTNVSDNTNALLTRQALSISEEGSRIQVKHGRVIGGGQSASKDFPWHLYNGIAYIRSGTVKLLEQRAKKYPKGKLLDVVYDIASETNIVAVDLTQPVSGENGSTEKLADLAGGSYATLTRRSVVCKEASGEGRQKLYNEIQWLLDLPENLRSYFPRILDHYMENDMVKFEMPFYDRPSLRKMIMTGDYSADDACNFLRGVLDFMFENVYNQGVRTAPSGWLVEKHLNRVHKRLIETCRQSEMLRAIIEAESITLNGKEYRNVADITFEIAKRSGLIKALTPSHMRMVHGDLHFQNILVGPMEKGRPFLLLDPRGELSGSDLFYDMGKLWHSVNGKYDFLHTNQFELSVDIDKKSNRVNATLLLTNQKANQSYTEICKALPEILLGYDLIKNDPNWRLKTMFAEAMHFCSVMPFHITGDGNDEKSATMYLTGVKVLNEFYENFDVNSWPEDQNNYLINVNTQTDYIKALEMLTTDKHGTGS